MSRVKDENFFSVQGWMVNPPYRLKGTELFLYAIIYGFSQTDNQRFTGSLQYLADWTNSTRQSVQANLKSLCRKGLLEKYEYEKNNIKFCEYRAKTLRGVQNFCTPMQKICTGGVQKICTGGVQKICTNNIYNNISYNIDDNPAPDDLRLKSAEELKKRQLEIEASMASEDPLPDAVLMEYRTIISLLVAQERT